MRWPVTRQRIKCPKEEINYQTCSVWHSWLLQCDCIFWILCLSRIIRLSGLLLNPPKVEEQAIGHHCIYTYAYIHVHMQELMQVKLIGSNQERCKFSAACLLARDKSKKRDANRVGAYASTYVKPASTCGPWPFFGGGGGGVMQLNRIITTNKARFIFF